MRTEEEILIGYNRIGYIPDEDFISVKNAIMAINEARKEAAIEFFKWNAQMIDVYDHLNNWVELKKFNNLSIEERYELFLKSLNQNNI